MREAIAVASGNPGAPFGAVLVDRRTGEVVARGLNASSDNPTLHGEVAAINDWVERRRERDNPPEWSDLALYTTAEPCPMCQGAILWAGISRVVYGASIDDLVELGWRQIAIPSTEVTRRSWAADTEITGGVLGDECRALFRR